MKAKILILLMIASFALWACNKDDDNQSGNNESQQQGQEGTKSEESQSDNDGGFISAASLADKIANLGAGSHEIKVNGELTTETLNAVGDALRAKYDALTDNTTTSKQASTAPMFSVNLDLTEATGLTKLETAVSDDGATYLGLAGCKALASLKLPNTLVEIQANAVAYCINLRNVTIPETVKNVADGAFFGCFNLENNKNFPNLRGMVIDATKLGEKIKELTEGVYFIQVVGAYDNNYDNEYAFFSNCRNKGIFVHLDIAEADASEVGDFDGTDAFKEDWLKAIVWSRTAPLTGWKFSNSASLTTVVIPDGVSKIETNGLFRDCDNLKNIVIADPTGWKKISNQKNETTGLYEDVEESVDKLTFAMLTAGSGTFIKD